MEHKALKAGCDGGGGVAACVDRSLDVGELGGDVEVLPLRGGEEGFLHILGSDGEFDITAHEVAPHVGTERGHLHEGLGVDVGEGAPVGHGAIGERSERCGEGEGLHGGPVGQGIAAHGGYVAVFQEVGAAGGGCEGEIRDLGDTLGESGDGEVHVIEKRSCAEAH